LSIIFSTLPSDIGDGNALTYYVAVTVDETTTYTSWVITKVQNGVNKYVQWRLMSQDWSTNESDWQGVSKEPALNSNDILESGGTFRMTSFILNKIQETIVWDGGTENRRVYYNSEGVKVNVGTGTLGGRWGTAKIPCADYVGKTIGISTYCTTYSGSVVRCLFVTSNKSVIENWNQNGYIEKLVPENAAYLLLSNYFATVDGTPQYTNPFVIGLGCNFDNVKNLEEKEAYNVLPLAEKTCLYFNIPWLGGSINKTSLLGRCYDSTGSLINAVSYYGASKLDVSSYVGKVILLNNNCSSSAYNLFKDSENNVLEYWQQESTKIITVPVGAKYLLLSNNFNNCTNPIIGIVYSNEEFINIQKRFFIKEQLNVNSGFYSETQIYNDSTIFNCAVVDVEEYAGKIIEISSVTALSEAYNSLKDVDGNVISLWRTTQDDYTQVLYLPLNAKTLYLSNWKQILDEPVVRVLDDSDLSQSFIDLYNFTHSNILTNDDYNERTENIGKLFIPCLYDNSVIVPSVSAGYTKTSINNPIESVNIDKISSYRKQSGSIIFPISIARNLLGEHIGVWVNPANYTSTLRIHCGVQNAEAEQRSYAGIDINLNNVLVGNSYSLTQSGFSIVAKCTSISQSGYVFFDIVVTSTNENDVYYNCLPYETGGALSNVDYEILVIRDSSDPYLKPSKVSINTILKTNNLYEKLCLPDKFIFEKGKTYMLFKHSMFMGINYKNYNIQIIVTDDPQTASEEQKWCKDYSRYIQYTPLAVGNVNAKIMLFDNNRNVLDEKNIILSTIEKTTQPSSMKTLLFVGDSLTYYNRITDEFYRVLTSNDAATTVQDTISIYNVKKPAGRNWGNITLIGTQKINHLGWIGQTFHEGRSGWQWSNFIKSGSPFYYNGAMDFNHYLSANSFNTPDVVYIGLGWNDSRSVAVLDEGKSINISAVMNDAKTFLDAITTQWPNTKVRLWTQNITGTRGGVGNHPHGALVGLDEQRMNLVQFSIMDGYKQLIQNYENVDLVWSTAFVDSEYSLQEENSDINTRISDKEVRGVDYVHPADSGFFEIADSIIADFCSLI